MPYNPDPRKKISREFHLSCLHAYHTKGHLLSEDNAFTLSLILRDFPLGRLVSRNLYYKAKDILRELHNRS